MHQAHGSSKNQQCGRQALFCGSGKANKLLFRLHLATELNIATDANAATATMAPARQQKIEKLVWR